MRNEERSGTTISDQDLVDRARRGDESALNALVTRHHEAVFRMALSMVYDTDTAQDVAQDAFIKAFRALDRFRGDAAFRTWLMTIAANEARGAIRKRGRRRETDIDAVEPVAAEGLDPGEAAIERSEADRARVQLAQLPEKQRLAVTLRVEEGLSFREIGDIIDSSEGAARVNYFHGIRRLRELLQ